MINKSGMSTTSLDEERPKKRLRKGTFSCWECKRRKVRCNYDDDQSICVGCHARGTTCLSQEYPEDHKQLPTEQPNSNAVADRLSRIEKVLEKLVDKIGSGRTEEDGRIVAAEALERLGIDVLQSARNENSAMNVLFDNAVFGHSRNDEKKPSSSPTTPISPPEHSASNLPSKFKAITASLISILPKQETVDLIVKAGHNWWIVKTHSRPFVDQWYLGLDPIHMLAERHPIIVGRALLYLVIAIQQLPSTFDRSQLNFSSAALMDKYHAVVSSRVLMDDELIGSIEGIECLILQGIYHINGARPRSGWLSMRRAMSICQILGIHRKSGRLAKESKAMSVSYMTDIWQLIVGADRYLALILGLPYGVGDSQFDLNFELDISMEEHFKNRLIAMTAEVIDWNFAPSNLIHTYDIDRRIDDLAAIMPPEWWRTPTKPVKSNASLGFGRTQDSSALFDRLMSQIWLFQIKILLHVPGMLRSSDEPQYSKSVTVCLEACRELIKRYIFFRKSNKASFCCKVIDFQAFTAATTLLLYLLGPIGSKLNEYRQQRDDSWNLVKDVTEVFEDLAKDTAETPNSDVVAIQGLKVLKALQADTDIESNMKVAIPYFGTVTISRSLRSSSSPKPVSTSEQVPSTFPNSILNSNDTQSSALLQHHQQHPHPQLLTVPLEQSMAQQTFSQQFPIVSFGSMPRPDPTQESWWCDWALQDRNGVPFQNMFDQNVGTSWYLQQ